MIKTVYLVSALLVALLLVTNNSIAVNKTRLAVGVATNSMTGEPPPELVGYYIYISDGVEIEKKIKTTGGNAWNFYGEYIKEVSIKKIGGTGSYQLFVIENDETVFKTNSITKSDPITYKK